MAKRKLKRKKKRSQNKLFLRYGILIAAGVLLVIAGILLIVGGDKYVSVTQMEVKDYEIGIVDTTQTQVFPRGVTMQGESLEGMTMKEAKELAEEYVQAYKDRAVTFSVGETNMHYYNGEMLGVEWRNPEVMDDVEKMLTTGNFVEQYIWQKDAEASPSEFILDLSCDEEYLYSEVMNICDAYTAVAANPACDVVGGQMVVTAGVIGREFDEQEIYNTCLSMVNDFTSTDLVLYDFPCVETYPDFDVDLLSFDWSVLGEYSTNNLGGGNREHNIATSADHMNGTIILPGMQASAMHNLYGDVTKEGGYLDAPTYNQGKQVNDISGGICQTTSTLYNALLRAEMKINYRAQHSMLVSYVPPSLDAMVSTSGGDFLFTNSSEYPIYIESYVADDNLVVRIWGKEERPANRTVAFESEVLEIRWPTPLYNRYANDEITTYGLAPLEEKAKAIVESHPYVRSRAYKVIYIDGVEQSREIFNANDTYKAMAGEIYHASDCYVVSEYPVEKAGGVYKYLGDIGYSIQHNVYFMNGETWDQNDPYGNYGRTDKPQPATEATEAPPEQTWWSPPEGQTWWSPEQ